MKHKVMFCDDQPDVVRKLTNNVRSVAPTDRYEFVDGGTNALGLASSSATAEAARALLGRRNAARMGSDCTDECVFDDVDILVLDYDLVHIDEDRSRHTGEGLARLARTFSRCGVVVVLNQFREVEFDLGMRGHLWSYADINISADLIDTAGLWTDPPWEGFRPWSWQTLAAAVETQKSRQTLVVGSFEDSIVDVLGIQEEDAVRFSDTAFEFLAPEATNFGDLARITFKDYLAHAGDRDAMAASSDIAAATRFVGARIGKWLEREVLGGQDVLVDIPHLVERYPFLLGGDRQELDAWNEAIYSPEVIRERVPTEAWFEPADFLSRPAVWRHRFEADAGISETSYSFDYSTVPPYAFLEDTSQFARLEDAKGFRAGHHNAFDARFVKGIDYIRYSPQRRFALGD